MSDKAEKSARIKGSKKKQNPDLAVFLARQYLCQSLKTSEIKTLLKYLTLRQFNEGDILADIGEVGEALYCQSAFKFDHPSASNFDQGKGIGFMKISCAV